MAESKPGSNGTNSGGGGRSEIDGARRHGGGGGGGGGGGAKLGQVQGWGCVAFVISSSEGPGADGAEALAAGVMQVRTRHRCTTRLLACHTLFTPPTTRTSRIYARSQREI